MRQLLNLTLSMLFFTGSAWAEPVTPSVELNQSNASDVTTFSQAQPKAKLAIIIDDIGNNLKAGLNALNLPGQVTYAVLPHRRHSQDLANRAARLGKEVMLHAPMSTLDGRFIGAGALSDKLNEKQFKDRLRHAIHSIPHISGMNNHMGSSLTQNTQAMNWVMEVLREEHLFFVDSRTTAETVAFTIAQQSGISSATRDVFLDHQVTTEHIHQQFKRAIAVAKKYGSAIAIGHPHKATLNYLNRMLPELAGLNVELISAGHLIAKGIESRPLPSGFAAPIQAPNLDVLVKYLAQK